MHNTYWVVAQSLCILLGTGVLVLVLVYALETCLGDRRRLKKQP
jgi:hypothetical protein